MVVGGYMYLYLHNSHGAKVDLGFLSSMYSMVFELHVRNGVEVQPSFFVERMGKS